MTLQPRSIPDLQDALRDLVHDEAREEVEDAPAPMDFYDRLDAGERIINEAWPHSLNLEIGSSLQAAVCVNKYVGPRGGLPFVLALRLRELSADQKLPLSVAETVCVQEALRVYDWFGNWPELADVLRILVAEADRFNFNCGPDSVEGWQLNKRQRLGLLAVLPFAENNLAQQFDDVLEVAALQRDETAARLKHENEIYQRGVEAGKEQGPDIPF